MSKQNKLYILCILIALQLLTVILLFAIVCYLGYITRYLSTISLFSMFYR